MLRGRYDLNAAYKNEQLSLGLLPTEDQLGNVCILFMYVIYSSTQRKFALALRRFPDWQVSGHN